MSVPCAAGSVRDPGTGACAPLAARTARADVVYTCAAGDSLTWSTANDQRLYATCLPQGRDAGGSQFTPLRVSGPTQFALQPSADSARTVAAMPRAAPPGPLTACPKDTAFTAAPGGSFACTRETGELRPGPAYTCSGGFADAGGGAIRCGASRGAPPPASQDGGVFDGDWRALPTVEVAHRGPLRCAAGSALQVGGSDLVTCAPLSASASASADTDAGAPDAVGARGEAFACPAGTRAAASEAPNRGYCVAPDASDASPFPAGPAAGAGTAGATPLAAGQGVRCANGADVVRSARVGAGDVLLCSGAADAAQRAEPLTWYHCGQPFGVKTVDGADIAVCRAVADELGGPVEAPADIGALGLETDPIVPSDGSGALEDWAAGLLTCPDGTRLYGAGNRVMCAPPPRTVEAQYGESYLCPPRSHPGTLEHDESKGMCAGTRGGPAAAAATPPDGAPQHDLAARDVLACPEPGARVRTYRAADGARAMVCEPPPPPPREHVGAAGVGFRCPEGTHPRFTSGAEDGFAASASCAADAPSRPRIPPAEAAPPDVRDIPVDDIVRCPDGHVLREWAGADERPTLTCAPARVATLDRPDAVYRCPSDRTLRFARLHGTDELVGTCEVFAFADERLHNEPAAPPSYARVHADAREVLPAPAAVMRCPPGTALHRAGHPEHGGDVMCLVRDDGVATAEADAVYDCACGAPQLLALESGAKAVRCAETCDDALGAAAEAAAALPAPDGSWREATLDGAPRAAPAGAPQRCPAGAHLLIDRDATPPRWTCSTAMDTLPGDVDRFYTCPSGSALQVDAERAGVRCAFLGDPALPSAATPELPFVADASAARAAEAPLDPGLVYAACPDGAQLQLSPFEHAWRCSSAAVLPEAERFYGCEPGQVLRLDASGAPRVLCTRDESERTTRAARDEAVGERFRFVSAYAQDLPATDVAGADFLLEAERWFQCDAGHRLEVNEHKQTVQCTAALQDPHDVWMSCAAGALEVEAGSGRFRCADRAEPALPGGRQPWTVVADAMGRVPLPSTADREWRRCPVGTRLDVRDDGAMWRCVRKGPDDPHGQFDWTFGTCPRGYVDFGLPEGARWGDLRDARGNFDLQRYLDVTRGVAGAPVAAQGAWRPWICQQAPLSTCNAGYLLGASDGACTDGDSTSCADALTYCGQASTEAQHNALEVCDRQGFGLPGDAHGGTEEALQVRAICRRLRADAAAVEFDGFATHHKASADSCEMLEDHRALDGGGCAPADPSRTAASRRALCGNIGGYYDEAKDQCKFRVDAGSDADLCEGHGGKHAPTDVCVVGEVADGALAVDACTVVGTADGGDLVLCVAGGAAPGDRDRACGAVGGAWDGDAGRCVRPPGAAPPADAASACGEARGALSQAGRCLFDAADGAGAGADGASCRLYLGGGTGGGSSAAVCVADEGDYTQQDLRCQLTEAGDWDAVLGRCVKGTDAGTHRACAVDPGRPYSPGQDAAARACPDGADGCARHHIDVGTQMRLDGGTLDFFALQRSGGLKAPGYNEGTLTSDEVFDFCERTQWNPAECGCVLDRLRTTDYDAVRGNTIVTNTCALIRDKYLNSGIVDRPVESDLYRFFPACASEVMYDAQISCPAQFDACFGDESSDGCRERLVQILGNPGRARATDVTDPQSGESRLDARLYRLLTCSQNAGSCARELYACDNEPGCIESVHEAFAARAGSIACMTRESVARDGLASCDGGEWSEAADGTRVCKGAPDPWDSGGVTSVARCVRTFMRDDPDTPVYFCPDEYSTPCAMGGDQCKADGHGGCARPATEREAALHTCLKFHWYAEQDTVRKTLQDHCPAAFNACAPDWAPGKTAEQPGQEGCLDMMVDVFTTWDPSYMAKDATFPSSDAAAQLALDAGAEPPGRQCDPVTDQLRLWRQALASGRRIGFAELNEGALSDEAVRGWVERAREVQVADPKQRLALDAQLDALEPLLAADAGYGDAAAAALDAVFGSDLRSGACGSESVCTDHTDATCREGSVARMGCQDPRCEFTPSDDDPNVGTCAAPAHPTCQPLLGGLAVTRASKEVPTSVKDMQVCNLMFGGAALAGALRGTSLTLGDKQHDQCWHAYDQLAQARLQAPGGGGSDALAAVRQWYEKVVDHRTQFQNNPAHAPTSDEILAQVEAIASFGKRAQQIRQVQRCALMPSVLTYFSQGDCKQSYEDCLKLDTCRDLLTEYLLATDTDVNVPQAGLWMLDLQPGILDATAFLNSKASDVGVAHWQKGVDEDDYEAWEAFHRVAMGMKEQCTFVDREYRPVFLHENARDGCVVDDRYYSKGGRDMADVCSNAPSLAALDGDGNCRARAAMKDLCNGDWGSRVPAGERWVARSCPNGLDTSADRWGDECRLTCNMPGSSSGALTKQIADVTWRLPSGASDPDDEEAQALLAHLCSQLGAGDAWDAATQRCQSSHLRKVSRDDTEADQTNPVNRWCTTESPAPFLKPNYQVPKAKKVGWFGHEQDEDLNCHTDASGSTRAEVQCSHAPAATLEAYKYSDKHGRCIRVVDQFTADYMCSACDDDYEMSNGKTECDNDKDFPHKGLGWFQGYMTLQVLPQVAHLLDHAGLMGPAIEFTGKTLAATERNVSKGLSAGARAARAVEGRVPPTLGRALGAPVRFAARGFERVGGPRAVAEIAALAPESASLVTAPTKILGFVNSMTEAPATALYGLGRFALRPDHTLKFLGRYAAMTEETEAFEGGEYVSALVADSETAAAWAKQVPQLSKLSAQVVRGVARLARSAGTKRVQRAYDATKEVIGEAEEGLADGWEDVSERATSIVGKLKSYQNTVAKAAVDDVEAVEQALPSAAEVAEGLEAAGAAAEGAAGAEEAAGAALDVTGVGAPLGVPINAAGAATAAVGLAMMFLGDRFVELVDPPRSNMAASKQ